MLNISARRAKIVFGVLLALVCVSMVITLIPGVGTPADPNAIQVVAEVGGEPITSYDVQRGVQEMARSNSLPPEMTWLYTEQVLDQLVLEKAAVMEAGRMGLRASQDEVRARLRGIPELFPEGRFVGQEIYTDLVLQRFGTSVPEFEQRVHASILLEKLRNVVIDSVSVSPEEVREAFRLDNEKLVLSYVFLDPAEFKKQVVASDAALQEYFDKNKDSYKIPEKRTVKAISLDRQKLRETMSVSDAEKRSYYQQHQDNYRVTERVSVRHILFRASKDDATKIEEAKKKAQDLLKQLKAGASFEELAKKNSEDTANAANGGDLGFIIRGQTVPPFEQAAFSLAPGAVSEPVQTEFGIHLLKVSTHEQARLKPFDEVQSEIQNLLLDDKVQNALSTSAEQVAAEWRRAPETADAVAAKYHGTVVSPPPIARGEALPSIAGSEPVSEDVFLLEQNQIGRPVPISTGYVIPRLESISPARPAEFAEVKEQVKTAYIDETATERLQAKGLELAQQVEQDPKRDLQRVARALGLSAKESAPLTRSGTIAGVGALRDLGPKLETIKPGEVGGPVPISGGQIVFQLVSREPANEADFASQSDGIRQRLLGEKQGIAYSLFQENLKTRLTEAGDIKIDKEAVERMNAAVVR